MSLIDDHDKILRAEFGIHPFHFDKALLEEAGKLRHKYRGKCRPTTSPTLIDPLAARPYPEDIGTPSDRKPLEKPR